MIITQTMKYQKHDFPALNYNYYASVSICAFFCTLLNFYISTINELQFLNRVTISIGGSLQSEQLGLSLLKWLFLYRYINYKTIDAAN